MTGVEKIFLELDTNYIQFLVPDESDGYDNIMVQRNVMPMTGTFDDETIHRICYDANTGVLGVIKHIKSSEMNRPALEVEPAINYFAFVEDTVVSAFMNAINKTQFYLDNIEGKYLQCIESNLPYFL